METVNTPYVSMPPTLSPLHMSDIFIRLYVGGIEIEGVLAVLKGGGLWVWSITL